MDTRIAVLFAAASAAIPPETAVLTDSHVPMPGAVAVVRLATAAPTVFAACTCCAPRDQAARLLHQLFMARARGEVPFFRQVVAIVADPAALRMAVQRDVLVQARYRVTDRA